MKMKISLLKMNYFVKQFLLTTALLFFLTYYLLVFFGYFLYNQENRNSTNPTNTSSTTANINKSCLEGFFGTNCDQLECGVTFVNRNTRIVGGVEAAAHGYSIWILF